MPVTSVHKAYVGTSHRKLKKLVHIEHGAIAISCNSLARTRRIKTGYQYVLAEAAAEDRMQ
jgi:hypothetical protein